MGFKMVIVPPNTQPDWPQRSVLRCLIVRCRSSIVPRRRWTPSWTPRRPTATLHQNSCGEHANCAGSRPSRGTASRLLLQGTHRDNVVVTNQREIYNDHIGAHIMAFILAFARGLHRYIPHQLQRQWRPNGVEPIIHLPEATALIIGWVALGARQRDSARPLV